MSIYHLLVAACWGVFIIVWGISALSAKRTTSNRMTSQILIRGVIVIAVAIAISEGHLQGLKKYYVVNSVDPLVGGFGVALCAIGITFAIWARVHIGRNWGMPRSVKENPDLVTSGPYKYVRHPIYTGVILGMAGSALIVGWAWVIATILGAVYFIYSAKAEEKLMLQNFPDTYPEYMRRTKMLIPFIF